MNGALLMPLTAKFTNQTVAGWDFTTVGMETKGGDRFHFEEDFVRMTNSSRGMQVSRLR